MLATTPNISLLASLRGTAPPPSPRWTRRPTTLQPLPQDEARRLFQDLAPNVAEDDPWHPARLRPPSSRHRPAPRHRPHIHHHRGVLRHRQPLHHPCPPEPRHPACRRAGALPARARRNRPRHHHPNPSHPLRRTTARAGRCPSRTTSRPLRHTESRPTPVAAPRLERPRILHAHSGGARPPGAPSHDRPHLRRHLRGSRRRARLLHRRLLEPDVRYHPVPRRKRCYSDEGEDPPRGRVRSEAREQPGEQLGLEGSATRHDRQVLGFFIGEPPVDPFCASAAALATGPP
jgi:hypothetical protein